MGQHHCLIVKNFLYKYFTTITDFRESAVCCGMKFTHWISVPCVWWLGDDNRWSCLYSNQIRSDTFHNTQQTRWLQQLVKGDPAVSGVAWVFVLHTLEQHNQMNITNTSNSRIQYKWPSTGNHDTPALPILIQLCQHIINSKSRSASP